MPGAICDNELALFGGEEAVGHVNRNVLFALSGWLGIQNIGRPQLNAGKAPVPDPINPE